MDECTPLLAGDEVIADKLHDVLLALMPRTNFLSLVPKPCVTTCTDDGELQCEALGGVVQIESTKTLVKCTWCQRLKQTNDI